MKDNMVVVDLDLTPEELGELSEAPSNTAVRGERDPEELEENQDPTEQ